ncbi:unnamed protein product [Rhodiola kirilowii]
MAEEEQNKIEEPVTETPSDPPPARSPEKDSIVPPSPTADDSKALVVVENPPDTVEEKSNEGSINRDAVLTRVSTEKKISLIKAWEESEKSKAENRTQKMIALNAAWERSKQAKIESELKLIEEKLEKNKAEYIEQMRNKIAVIHKLAEEKRAIIEAKKGEDLLKAEETAAKHRATGTSPVKSGWFRF